MAACRGGTHNGAETGLKALDWELYEAVDLDGANMADPFGYET